MANHLPRSGGMQKMIESMQKEIDKRFLRGIAASPGIVIGNSFIKGYAVFKEPTGGGMKPSFRRRAVIWPTSA